MHMSSFYCLFLAHGQLSVLCFIRNLLNCCTTVGTTRTNPEQIELIELGGNIQPTRNKLSTVVSVVNKVDRRRVLETTRSTCRGEIF